MDNKVFRLFENESKVWICKDQSIRSADFPEYLKMMQMRDQERYSLCQRTGVVDLDSNYIYECDIVIYNGKTYKVLCDSVGFLLECLTDGEVEELIPFDALKIVGNIHEAA